MSDRIALVADDDTDFRQRLSAILAPLGLHIEVTSGEDETLDLLRRRGPEVVFIAVDLPDKAGFALFSKVKKARRRVPVVMVTSTVPKADLGLHEKLKIHAEAYVDKRTIGDEKLGELLQHRIGLSPLDEGVERKPSKRPAASDPAVELSVDEGEASQPESVPAPDAAPGQKRGLEPWLAELLDPETAAILADLDEDAVLDAVPKSLTAKGEVSPERLDELEQEVEVLREELAEARRDAQSSPFSSEFVSLREVASRKDKEIRALRDLQRRRDSQVAVVKTKLTEFARKLLEAQSEQHQSREAISELKGGLEALQARLKRLAEDSEEQERRHELESRTLRQNLAEIEERHIAERRSLESQLSSLRAAHARELQDRNTDHLSALSELEKKFREQKLRLAEELKSKYAEKANELREAHDRSMGALREEHERDTESIHASHRDVAARSAEQAQEALRQAAEKSATALEKANQQRLSELAGAEDKRRHDISAWEKRHREEMDALRRQHQTDKEALAHELSSEKARNERISTEFGAKIQDVVKALEEERKSHQDIRERYEQEIAALQSSHSKHMEQAEQDQFSALAGLSRKFREDRARLLEVERQKWEQTARELHQDHTTALEGLEKQYRDEVEALKVAHAAALRQKDGEATQTAKQEVERVRARMQEELDKTRRAHADEIAALRQEHEKEVSSLQAAHMESLQKRDRESHESIREAIEAAKADWNERYEKATYESSEALATQRREYEEEIAALEKAHRDAVTKREQESREALRRMEEEREEARGTADGLRAELAELEAKHRSTTALAEERQKAEIRELTKESKTRIGALEEEKQFLAASVERLKRQSAAELTRALDSLAHEKKLHQASQDRYERRLAELNARHAEGIKQIEADWMEKFQRLETSFNERNDKGIAHLEGEWKARVEKERLAQEEATRAIARESEMELAAMNQQLERSRGLEESYQSAVRELTAAKARIDELNMSLVEAGKELTDRDAALKDQARRNQENAKTIDSLKAVIDDFSRSVEGYMRDREESDQTISSLKAVIDDFYRSIDGGSADDRKN